MNDDLYNELTKGIEIITRRSSWLLDEKLSRHAFDRVGALRSQCEEMQAFRRLYLEDIRKLREFMRAHEQCSQREWLTHFEGASAMWEKYVSIKDCLFKRMIP